MGRTELLNDQGGSPCRKEEVLEEIEGLEGAVQVEIEKVPSDHEITEAIKKIINVQGKIDWLLK